VRRRMECCPGVRGATRQRSLSIHRWARERRRQRRCDGGVAAGACTTSWEVVSALVGGDDEKCSDGFVVSRWRIFYCVSSRRC